MNDNKDLIVPFGLNDFIVDAEQQERSYPLIDK
jgi:hypothetical protein